MVVNRILIMAVVLSIMSVMASAETGVPDNKMRSLLRAGDEILCVGDSITAQGVYTGFLQQAIDTAYPGQQIRVVNLGVGGMTAPGGVESLRGYLKDHTPTVVTVMFGVNDTGWSSTDAEVKAKNYETALKAYIALAQEKKFRLIFLRETGFSHSAEADVWVAGVNVMLDQLLVVQDRVGREADVPVIDVHNAYLKALNGAWTKDSRYELTPDVVHPTQPGHAAMVAEIMRAFGIGLPLAIGEQRGPVRVGKSPRVTLQALDTVGVSAAKKNSGSAILEVNVTNLTSERLIGELSCMLGGRKSTKVVKLAAYAHQLVSFNIDLADMKERWTVLPSYLTFITKDSFDANEALFFCSTVIPVVKQTAIPVDFQLEALELKPTVPCPVKDLVVSRQGDALTVSFTWEGAIRIPAHAGFKNRYGKIVDTPLDLLSRDGQPCDAVELFFDTRSILELGRYTSDVDANPAGITRIGIYHELQGDKLVAAVQALPTTPVGSIQPLTVAGNRYTLTVTLPPAQLIGFSATVSARETFGTSGNFYRLTGRPNVVFEPMSYMLLGSNQPQKFYRIGY